MTFGSEENHIIDSSLASEPRVWRGTGSCCINRGGHVNVQLPQLFRYVTIEDMIISVYHQDELFAIAMPNTEGTQEIGTKQGSLPHTLRVKMQTPEI